MKLYLKIIFALACVGVGSSASANTFTISLNATQVVGGTSILATVTEASDSGSSGDSYTVSTSGTGVLAPASVVVAPYSKTATMMVATSTVSGATPASVTATSSVMGSQTAGFTVVGSPGFYSPYSFTGDVDGNLPLGGVAVDGSGNVYGTADEGGAYGNGTVWQLSASGTFSVLYSFTGNNDGSGPTGGVSLDGAGNLYGTTNSGGAGGGGTIWELSPSGTLTTLYSFTGNSDGSNPFGGVALDGNGNLYGTAYAAGANSSGTVWEVTAGGTFSTLYAFTGNNDGSSPYGGVALDASGNLYGTASAGGPSGNGTVWQINPSGTFTAVYGFTGGSDGGTPYGGVAVDKLGNVYGTTSLAGGNGGGSIWQVSSGGNFTGLYSFSGATDGDYSTGNVVLDANGNLYGTTTSDGPGGNGTIWEFSATGTFSAVYSFSGNLDGSSAAGNIAIDPSGTLYGIASTGGSNSDGTAWVVVPVPPALSGISLSTNLIMGGSNVIGTVALTSPAWPGGYTVSLGSSSRFAAVPPVITVPAGATSASFPIWTDPCSSTQVASVSATDGLGTYSTNLSLSAYSPSVFNVQLASTFIVGGSTVSAGVQLDHFVTSPGGEVVTLSASNADGSSPALATVPSSVTVPLGANSATFSVSTSNVSAISGVNIVATDGASQSGLLMLMPSGGLGLGILISPQGIFGGNSATGSVTLTSAQLTDTIVGLSSSSSVVAIPATVTIPAGQTSATFPVTTNAISGTTSVLNGGWVWIAAATGTVSQAIPVSVYPSQLHSISASPSSVAGGGSATGTVTLSGVAPSGGITVGLNSNSSSVQVPPSVTVAAGSSSATFSIATSTSQTAVNATLTATYSGTTKVCGFGVGASVFVHSIAAVPGTVVGGSSATGTVTLTAAAPPGGLTISLSSNNSLASTVPASATIPAGSIFTTFPITTNAVSTAALTTLSASLGGVVKSCGLMVSPPSLQSLTGSTSVIGGSLINITATLNGPAPTGGTSVTLSSNSGYAVVPLSITIPAGSTSAHFLVDTNAVKSATSVVITGVRITTIHLTIRLLP